MITIRVTPPAILRPGLGSRVNRRISGAINRTLEEGQSRGRQLLHQRLTVRTAGSARFLEQRVLFAKADRATPENLSGRMGLQSTGEGTKVRSAALLIRLATGETSRRTADSPFWIPTTGPQGLRPVPPAIIPRAMYPKQLRLQESRYTIADPSKQAHRGRRGGILVRGQRRTFAIDPEFHRANNLRTYGIWQREGHGHSARTMLLWSYRLTRRLPKRLPFVETVMAELRARWPINIAGFFSRPFLERGGR